MYDMIWKNRWHMMKVSWFQAISATLIISFLLFFVNILSGVAYQVSVSGAEIQQKLGMYFYLQDSDTQKDAVYARTIDLIDELKQGGLDVQFYSKDDAFDLLAQRLPNVIGNLEKYGIGNPLPATLYVLFDSQSSYEHLKKTILRYEDIIVNLNDLTGGLSFTAQEQRVSKVINMLNSLQYLSYFLIAVTILIVLSFLGYAIRINFFRFHKQIEVEKLLGAPYSKIIGPFLLYILCILAIAFILVSIYLFFLASWLHGYTMELFNTSLYDSLPATSLLLQYGAIEVIGVFVLSLIFGSFSLRRLLKKI